jgi:hypothetical protein
VRESELSSVERGLKSGPTHLMAQADRCDEPLTVRQYFSEGRDRARRDPEQFEEVGYNPQKPAYSC